MTAATALSTIPQVFAVSSNLWEELSDAAGLIIAVLFIMAGALIGFVLRWLIGKWQADSIEQSARLKAEAVQAEVESLRKEAEVSARAEVVKAREEFEASIASRRSDQEQVEARLLAREQSLDRRTTLLDAREAVLRAKAEEEDEYGIKNNIGQCPHNNSGHSHNGIPLRCYEGIKSRCDHRKDCSQKINPKIRKCIYHCGIRGSEDREDRPSEHLSHDHQNDTGKGLIKLFH